jgi:glycine hydroxymethyltransferase
MGVDEMKRVGAWIHEALSHADDDAILERIAGEVRDLCEGFPVPADRAALAVV